MLLLQKSALLVVVLSLVVPPGSHGYYDADKCLVDHANNTEGIATCFRAFQTGPYALCFNDTSIEAFQECMDANPGTADAWECGGVMMCAYDTFLAGSEAYLEGMEGGGLDACVRSTAAEFLRCGMANLASCHEPCEAEYSEDTSTLFPESLVPAATCDAFQSGVADVACGPTSCCSTCQDELEAVLECAANAVFGLPQCDLVCTGGDQVASPAGTRTRTRRELVAPPEGLDRPLSPRDSVARTSGLSTTRRRFLEEEEETLDAHVSSECPYSLVNSTTLQSLASTPALFLDCVILHYLWMFTDEGVEYVTGGSSVNGTGSNATSSSSGDAAEGDEDGAAGAATSGSAPAVAAPFVWRAFSTWSPAIGASASAAVVAVAVAAVVA